MEIQEKFGRDNVNLITSARYVLCQSLHFRATHHIRVKPNRVGAVNPQYVIYTTRSADGKTEQHTIPTNFVLWSTGIAMNPFTGRVASLLPNQVHKKAIEVDAHLRVKGAPLGDVYAIGDCATVSS